MKDSQSLSSLNDIFGPVIVRYTRAQALLEGVLVDAGALASEAGFQWPVALTRAVWEDCVVWRDADDQRQVHQDATGRLWDVLFMAALAARGSARAGNQRCFSLCRIPRDGVSTTPVEVALKLMVGPGDAGEPVITILQPHEE
ncbi:hypothetical protein CWI75_07935 [Kineobactrum sediminis]|uniref:Uncharacterized protein n=1 Tax=Kineobactrum sediminis TaxID=1905677 RepID=A0A2N5Y4J9_9GAMM|nr:DUF6573 family protein [Kineobactrum sediminis]PLW83320.1 hypothetical protein CWI75_07935 [Kineobactrum sediminis]